MKKIVIIGAGISGLFFANLLRQNSEYQIMIYEKNNSINLDKGYGIQLSVNSIKLLNKIGFYNINSEEKFNPKKLDFYSLNNNKKICNLDISTFNDGDIKYTTLQRSVLIGFLKDKLPNNFINYNKKIIEIDQYSEKIKLKFEDKSFTDCDYLIISDGVFSTSKSLVVNKEIKPSYFNSIAIRATVPNKYLQKLDHNNISLFLGSNLHSVIYPVDKGKEFNFVCLLKKKLTDKEIKNYTLFKNKDFISSILSKMKEQIDHRIIDNIRNIKCFPIFVSKKIYNPKRKSIFFIGDAFFSFPPTFAQGASQSIEVAYDLYINLQKNKDKFIHERVRRTRMINNKSKFNYFIFHLSNPLTIFMRNLIMKYLVKNKNFIKRYLGKIYRY